MILFPGFVVGLALLCGITIVPILVMLSHGELRIESAKSRFLCATIFCFLFWLMASILWVDEFGASEGFNFYGDFLAGAAILFTGIIAWGILWSLVCWGFTTSLALSLAGIGKPATDEMWFKAYGGGGSIEEFITDRLSILLALSLARKNERLISITSKKGTCIVIALVFLRRFYGIDRSNRMGNQS
jgi:hypothetical protein